MKTCSNPDCSYHTRFDDYLTCPKCGSPLLDARTLTGTLPPEELSEAQTSPFVPVSRLQSAEGAGYEGGHWQYVQQPLPYQEPVGMDGAVNAGLMAAGDDPAETLRPLHSNGLGRFISVRTLVVAGGGLALVTVCLVLALSLSSRFTSRPVLLNSAGVAATETAVASLRPPVNTPISILPTIPLSVAGAEPGSEAQSQTSAGSDANPKPGANTKPDANPKSKIGVPSGPPKSPLSPAPISDALMCARLEGGQPAGPTGAYHPTDPFNLAIKAEFGPGGVQSVLTRWYGPDNTQIYEMKHTYSQQGTYYAGFTVSKNAPWAPGSYRADIFTNDSPQPVRSVTFRVIP